MKRGIGMNRIRQLRKQKGVTLQKVEFDTGIKVRTFSNYEIRKSNPSREKTKIIADYFNVSEAYLLGYSDDDSSKLDFESVADYLTNLSDFDYKKMIEVVESRKEE